MHIHRIDKLQESNWLPRGEIVVSVTTYRDFLIVVTDRGSVFKLSFTWDEVI